MAADAVAMGLLAGSDPLKSHSIAYPMLLVATAALGLGFGLTLECISTRRLRSAYEFATSALQRAEASGKSDDLVTLDARLALAEVLFEQNELEGAEAHLETARRLCRTAGGSDWKWAVEVDLVRLLIARQRPGDALNRLGHLRHLEGRKPPADLYVTHLVCQAEEVVPGPSAEAPVRFWNR